MPEITKCRVCDGGPLVEYYGLCQECQDATVRFWYSRSQKKQRQQENSERQAKNDELRNRPPTSRPTPDADSDGVEETGYLQQTSGGGGDQPGGQDPGDGVQRSTRRYAPLRSRPWKR